MLAMAPESPSDKYKFPHYLILDTNVVLDQIDVLEEAILTNIIILHTVLDEVKHKSSVVYKKLRDILKRPTRQFYVFVNEHHKDTYVDREPGETNNDRNDRAIRVAAHWYNKHLLESQRNVPKENRVRTVLITEDADNRRKAEEIGLTTCSIREYVESMSGHKMLADKLSQKNLEYAGPRTEFFPQHLAPAEIHDGIRTGKLKQGSFAASRENYLEGFCNVEGYELPVFLQGRVGLNRAVDGDIVAIEMLPEAEWSAPSEVILVADGHDVEAGKDEDVVDDDEDSLDKKKDKRGKVVEVEKRPTGKVVGIIRRKWRQYCGILQLNPNAGATKHLFISAERKIPKIRIETRQAENLSRNKIVVAIDQWPRHSRYPMGHFVRILGPIGDKTTENEVLLLENDVPHSKFSEEVLSCLPQMPWTITAEDYAKRVDLRELNICSVDPPGCNEIDDALHCRELSPGRFEVGVHIADVTHFIRPGTAVDREAANRATNVYLVDQRINMLPELLSCNLCSLEGGKERFAFSCIWELNENAEIVNTRFHKSVIKSKRALSYEEAQLLIDDPKQQDALTKGLRGLNMLAKKLKARRMERGALVLSSPEIRFHMDSETRDPIEVEAKKPRETNSMVEEFMLLANVSVAEKIEKEFPECAMLRRHPQPPAANFELLLKAAKYQGFEIAVGTGKELADSLDAAVKEDNAYFNTMLRIIATRCMMQAVYFISGTVQKVDFFHYGLAAPIYTHFTSPIRRYADVIVHRLLAACIAADSTYPELLDKRSSSLLCNNLNYRNRMAQQAERASVALNTHLFFRGKCQEEDGYVLFVRKNALTILIPKFGMEGTIYVADKNGQVIGDRPKFTYDEEDHTQTCQGVTFHAFDPVTVRLSLDSTNVQHQKIVLELVHPYIEGFSVAKDGGELKRKPTAAMEVDEEANSVLLSAKKKKKGGNKK